MPLTIGQVFDLPAREAITAGGFVVKLADDGSSKLVSDYVITPKVASELPVVLSAMHHVWQTGEEFGRFVHGSFGSGKSHFMAFLGLLLERQAEAWDKAERGIPALGKHRQWLGDARLLVVRINLLTVSRPGMGFDRFVYEETNRALQRAGKAPFEFLHVDGVLDEARREAEQYGDAFWKNLERAGVVGSQAEFEEQARGGNEDREALARAYLEYKGRDVAAAGMDPRWSDGLQRLTRHVKSQGYGGLVLLVDELLLWLKEKTAPEFRAVINQLNVMVDHTDGMRALPLFAFVARQRNIEEFFPDLVDEHALHEHLAHHSKRFEETTLEDVELRHVCRGRVVKRRPEHAEAVETVVGGLAERHGKILSTLLHGADVGYLRDVYPFHPALIEMLIDVSALMQRDRTALRLLFELLVIHYPDLPLGAFLPVGSAFEALFPESGVEGSKRVDTLRAIHRTYYFQLRPAMDEMVRMAKESGGEFNEQRRHVLDQIVKTVLLGEVSNRLKGTTVMTVGQLVQLNDVEVEGETDRARMNRVHQDLVELSRLSPSVQVSGTGREATVMAILQKVNVGEILDRARSRLAGHSQPLFRAFYAVLLPTLGLPAERGTLPVLWRRTERKGSYEVTNVRELGNARFRPEPGDEFRLLIDYPWDEPGHSVEEDELRARDVNRRDGSMLTACWLPRHFTPQERAWIEDLAALDFMASPGGQEELLQSLGPQDREFTVDWARQQMATLTSSLKDRLREVYRDHGRIVALVRDVGSEVPDPDLSKNPERIAQALLDRQFPMHPTFGAKPSTDGLEKLCDWLVKARAAGDQSQDFDEATDGKVLRSYGLPLELVNLGQTRGSIRLDTRYIKTVLDEALSHDSVLWDAIDRKLAETYGLQPLVRNLFLAFLVRADSFRALNAASGEPVEVKIDGRPRSGVKLQRAPLLDVAEWSTVRALGPDLLGATKPAPLRSLAEQDRYANELRELATERRGQISGLHEQIFKLGPSGDARLADLKQARDRLSPLVGQGKDSYQALTEWHRAWTEDPQDPVRITLLRVRAMREALEALDETARRLLLPRAEAPKLGERVRAHLGVLAELLGARETVQSLKRDVIRAWNDQAEAIVHDLVGDDGYVAPPPPPPPLPQGRVILVSNERVRARNPEDLARIAEQIKAGLSALKGDEFLVSIEAEPVKSK
jgi:hypothetical protein